MENGKTPGLDGFPTKFYKEMKAEMTPIFAQMYKEIQTMGYLHPTINATMVSLIPEIPKPSMLKHWRPISLCNVSHKLITKVLAVRMSSSINELIDDSQSAFVKGRKIVNSITMASECLHTERTQKKGMMILKADTSKAYDTLEWDYLLSMLCLKGVGAQNLKWFVACLKTTNMAILINGRMTESFSISKGIKQGCPLSLYLFTIIAEGLSTMLDDLILIGKTSLSEVLSWEQALKVYIEVAGVPISVRKMKAEDWMPFLERIRGKLSQWPHRFLNLIDEKSIFQSIISQMPNFSVSLILAPKSVLRALRSKAINFLWSLKVGQQATYCPVGWDKVTAPLWKGGLRIRDLYLLADVRGAKRCWVFLQEDQRKWKEVLLSKYCFDSPREDMLSGTAKKVRVRCMEAYCQALGGSGGEDFSLSRA
eukprot:Gb_26363 [translate_table: standard]